MMKNNNNIRQRGKIMKVVYDHLGKRFESITAKCEYWGIPRITYLRRIKYGFTEEEALTISTDAHAYAKSKKKVDKNSVVDHLGNVFPSITAKCEYWGIPRVTYLRRLHKYGYTEEEALTIPISKRRTSTKLYTTV